ncbi:hypothetical protein LINPERHAP2_LOCUS15566 [Linum perenne]
MGRSSWLSVTWWGRRSRLTLPPKRRKGVNLPVSPLKLTSTSLSPQLSCWTELFNRLNMKTSHNCASIVALWVMSALTALATPNLLARRRVPRPCRPLRLSSLLLRRRHPTPTGPGCSSPADPGDQLRKVWQKRQVQRLSPARIIRRDLSSLLRQVLILRSRIQGRIRQSMAQRVLKPWPRLMRTSWLTRVGRGTKLRGSPRARARPRRRWAHNSRRPRESKLRLGRS